MSQDRNRKLRRLGLIFATGLCIEAVLLIAEIPKRIQDIGADAFMRLYNTWHNADAQGDAFVYIDIDDATVEAWGRPSITPRDKLAKLLDFARAGKPKLIVVDVDLSKESEPKDDAHQRKKDDALKKSLSEFGAFAKSGGSGETYLDVPHIVLARSFRRDSSNDGSRVVADRKSFLDDIVASNQANIHWASTLFRRDADFTIRRWILWQPVCRDGTPDVVASAQLTAASILLVPELDMTKFKHKLRKMACRSCDCDGKPRDETDDLRLGKRVISLVPGLVASRIFFTIPWPIESQTHQPTVLIDDVRTPGGTRIRAPRVTRIPARLITEAPTAPNPELLHRKVVVIGNSSSEGRDIHATPIGPMPGAVILINAISSLDLHGTLKKTPLWLKALFAVFLLLVVCLCFYLIAIELLAALVAFLIVVAATLVASYHSLSFGVWIDATIPSLAIILHFVIASLERMFAHD